MPNQINQLKNKISYATIESPVFDSQWQQKLRDLPLNIQKHCLKFHQTIDQKRRTLAYLQLCKLLNDINISETELNTLSYNEFKKPYLRNYPELFFNISYSNDYALVALFNHEVGIDIEKINLEINLLNYEKTFSTEVWLNIMSSKQPIISFFKNWTQLEAAIKAHGSGFYTNTNHILFQKDFLNINNEIFYIYPLEIDNHYIAHLSSNVITNFTCKNFLFS